MSASDPPPDLVIFDCDGVLVDSEPIAIELDLVLLERVGLKLTRQELIDRFLGRSDSVLEEAIAAHLGHPLDDTRLRVDTVPGVPPPPDLVIFDCDGVLVDSESIAAELEVEMFAEVGMPMTLQQIRERFLGRTAAFTNAAIVEHLGELPDGW